MHKRCNQPNGHDDQPSRGVTLPLFAQLIVGSGGAVGAWWRCRRARDMRPRTAGKLPKVTAITDAGAAGEAIRVGGYRGAYPTDGRGRDRTPRAAPLAPSGSGRAARPWTAPGQSGYGSGDRAPPQRRNDYADSG